MEYIYIYMYTWIYTYIYPVPAANTRHRAILSDQPRAEHPKLFFLYSAYRNGSQKVRNTGRSARHFFSILF